MLVALITGYLLGRISASKRIFEKINEEIRYVVYLGGTPMYFNTRKKRDAYWKRMKRERKYKWDGNQDRDNYKDYMWKRVFKGNKILE